MLSRLREFLTLVLIAVLPLHGFLVTVATRVILGPGHAPWTYLAVWKEGLLAFILLIACFEMLMNFKKIFQIDVVDVLIVLLCILGVAVSQYRPWMTPSSFALGFKYDFVPLIAFTILRRVEWSKKFWTSAEHALLWVAGIIAAYGIITFFLPASFFTQLGYSDAHSLYLPRAPLSAFQQISGSSIRRIQSTFSGPNQLGIWLLIPISLLLQKASGELKGKRGKKHKNPFFTKHFALLVLLGLALTLTFSRSAWIGAFVIVCALAYRVLPRRVFGHALMGVLSLVIIVGVTASVLLPSIFFRTTSTWGHLVRPLQAIHEMQRYPLGFGLGQAGPAANHTHEPCVYLPAGGDASWAKTIPQLCVFLGDIQVQPVEHQCNCALLPENWYLQIGVEMGVIGLMLYVALIAFVLGRLGGKKSTSVLLFFVGISVAALFLHAWEDSAVAYTGWILIATVSTLHPWSTKAPSSSWISGASTRT